MWTILGTQDEASFFDSHVRAIIAQESHALPERQQRIGHVEVRWEQVAPKSAFIQAVGGTHADRLIARKVIEEQLRGHGYRLASWSFDSFQKTADWTEVQDKAKRLIQEGNVQILRNGYKNIVAQVKGDHGTYPVEIFRQDPNSRAMTGSDCECDWGSFQNTPRTRQWKQYQDRPCAHILAAWWQAQATPIDEQADPRGPGGPQGDPFNQMPAGWSQQGLKQPPPGGQGQLMDVAPAQPGAGVTPGQFRMAPGAPSGQLNPDQMSLMGQGAGGAQQGAGAAMGPSPRDVLPQFPMEGLAQGQINPASIPGAKGPTPTNPINYPAGPGGAFSSVRQADQAFTNGDIVQLRYDDTGTLVGPSEAHGAGQETTIKGGQLGEVRGTHPSTGMVEVLYMGSPWDQNGRMMPYGATAWHYPSYLVPRPDVRPPGPAIRRPR